jgi:hypothetical protein
LGNAYFEADFKSGVILRTGDFFLEMDVAVLGANRESKTLAGRDIDTKTNGSLQGPFELIGWFY